MTLPCAKCHRPEGSEFRFQTGKRLCPECHADSHGGEFASEPYNNRCDLCHTEAGFDATTFSRERHAQTQFPLTGRHTEVECLKCHKPLSGDSSIGPETSKPSTAATALATGETIRAPDLRLQFHFASRDCNACHHDPHGMTPKAGLTCQTCHTPQQWAAVLPFDHSGAQFKFEGAHQKPADTTACIKCHTASAQAEGGAAVPVFSGVPGQCSRCHAAQEPHGGQFITSNDEGADCSMCHTSSGWGAGGFDHNKTRFALTGSHRDIACTKCHKEQIRADGKAVLLYRGTPIDCLKCH